MITTEARCLANRNVSISRSAPLPMLMLAWFILALVGPSRLGWANGLVVTNVSLENVQAGVAEVVFDIG
ncbi:MAG: hypothetical protein FJ387_29915 [Verrucomicrobia bacterium]|nr:hypothetical protein [Verrucomicrobiota bacterium]